MTHHQQNPDGEPVDRWRRWLRRATRKAAAGAPDAARPRRTADDGIAATPPARKTSTATPAAGKLPAGTPPTRWVPVLSGQEGVGQTTVTTLLGLALAQLRAGRVIAVDADPRHGTLADRSPGTATFTARQVARERFMADAFARLPADAAHPPLHILAAVAVADAGMGTGAAPNHGTLADQLARYYSIVLTDPGSAMVQAALRGTLDAADAVVLVSGTGADEARRASEMLSWLEAHGRADLAGRAIVVLNQSAAAAHPEESAAHPEEAEAHFADRVPHVIRLPHDPHLAHGSRIELARLSPATRAAVLELAALLTAELKD